MNDLTYTNIELERLATVFAGVELLTIEKSAGIVEINLAALGRIGLAITFLMVLDLVFGKEILVFRDFLRVYKEWDEEREEENLLIVKLYFNFNLIWKNNIKKEILYVFKAKIY